jgi:hypothetical protein
LCSGKDALWEKKFKKDKSLLEKIRSFEKIRLLPKSKKRLLI